MDDPPQETIKRKDLECRKNSRNECVSCSESLRGRCINYTSSHPSYLELNMYDKMDYAFYMMNYNVEDKKEFAEGIEDLSDVRGNISFELVRRPQKLVNIMSFLGFVLLVVMVIMFVLMYVVVIFGIQVSPAKKDVMMWMIIFLFGLMTLTYILDYVYNKAIDRIEIVGDNIK